MAEGLEVLDSINGVIVNDKHRPLQNIRVKHCLVIEDPFEGQDHKFGRQTLSFPSRSPSPSALREKSGIDDLFIEDDVNLDQMKDQQSIVQDKARTDAKNRAHVLEILDDLPEADIEPPKNVLFVCKLNPVTQSDDLEVIFSRFGQVASCEVIRDWKTGDSL